MIHDDTYTLGLLPVDSCGFEFGEGESPTFAQFPVITHGLATNGRSQTCKGTQTKGSGLGFTRSATPELAAGLVEPGADSPLPVLAEVVGRKSWVALFRPGDTGRKEDEPLLCRKPMVNL